MRRRVLGAVAVLALLVAAYALGAARGGEDPVRRVIVGASTEQDATGDKWVTAECPDGYTVVGGGAQVPHANDTPGVALYWSAPYEDRDAKGWWAAAQDTARRKEPWVLQAQVICLSGVEDGGGTALPAETFSPAE